MLIFISFISLYTGIHACLCVCVTSNSRGEWPLSSDWVVLFHISHLLANLQLSSPEHALISGWLLSGVCPATCKGTNKFSHYGTWKTCTQLVDPAISMRRKCMRYCALLLISLHWECTEMQNTSFCLNVKEARNVWTARTPWWKHTPAKQVLFWYNFFFLENQYELRWQHDGFTDSKCT